MCVLSNVFFLLIFFTFFVQAPKFTFTSSSRKLAVRAVAAPPGALSTEPPPEEIIPAVDAEVPGIIPPSGTIPNAPGGYYRTTWSDETDEAVIDGTYTKHFGY